MKLKTKGVARWLNSRVWSFELDMVYPLVYTSPHAGRYIVASLDEDYTCPGNCVYCNLKFQNTYTGSYGPHTDTQWNNWVKGLTIITRKYKLDSVFLNEKIEMGLRPHAVARFRDMYAQAPSNLHFYLTTKLPAALLPQVADLDRVTILATLTNPLGMDGYEGKAIPSFEKRVADIIKLHKSTGHVFGLRAIISQEAEVAPIFKAVKKLIEAGAVNQDHVLVGFLRSNLRAGKKNGIHIAVQDFISKDEFDWHRRHGMSIVENTMISTMAKFHKLGVTFDRIPHGIRKKYSQYNYNEYATHRECYVMPGKACIQKASENDHGACDGICKNGNICPNLFDRPKDFVKARKASKIVTEKRQYAYGKRTRMEPLKDFKKVLAMLFNSKELCKHYGVKRERFLTFSGNRKIDLKEVTHG